jgi:putative toxin-antitoxin system antitoxin component (TIGR02293 family)
MAASKRRGATVVRDVEPTAADPATRAYRSLLGLAPGAVPDVVDAVKRGLRYRAFERFVENSSLSTAATAALVNIPVRTLSRRKREGRLQPDESDRLLRASRVMGRAIDLFEGDRAEAKQWLARPQRALGGATPFEMARTEVGALAIERLIDQLEQGVFV